MNAVTEREADLYDDEVRDICPECKAHRDAGHLDDCSWWERQGEEEEESK